MTSSDDIKALKKEWDEKGVISTNFSTGDTGRTAERIEKILNFEDLDSVAVVGHQTSVLLHKGKTREMVHKLYYVASMFQSSHISCFKKGKEIDLPTKTYCTFSDFSAFMSEFGCKYSRYKPR